MTLVVINRTAIHTPGSIRSCLSKLSAFARDLCLAAERYSNAAHQVYVSPFEPGSSKYGSLPERLLNPADRNEQWEGPL